MSIKAMKVYHFTSLQIFYKLDAYPIYYSAVLCIHSFIDGLCPLVVTILIS